jgi:hypothetical protein
VSAKVSFDQPIFDVWLASTLEDTDYVSQDGQTQSEMELTQASLACIPAYDGHNEPSWWIQSLPVYRHGHTNYRDSNLCKALSATHQIQTEPKFALVICVQNPGQISYLSPAAILLPVNVNTLGQLVIVMQPMKVDGDGTHWTHHRVTMCDERRIGGIHGLSIHI